jgi:flagellar biosynthesis/type III secretory pathway protein FliH
MYKSIFERVYTERGREKGLQEGLQKGLQDGLQKGKLEMAKDLLARGVSPDTGAEPRLCSRRPLLCRTRNFCSSNHNASLLVHKMKSDNIRAK